MFIKDVMVYQNKTVVNMHTVTTREEGLDTALLHFNTHNINIEFIFSQ